MNWNLVRRSTSTANQTADDGREDDSTDRPIAELEAVTVRLGEVTALDGVDLAVPRGQFVGLIGPNGAGKTTLIRSLTGAVAPHTGTVRVDGTDVRTLSSRAASRKMAVVPQDTSLAFDLDVSDIVSMGRTPYRSRLARWQPTDRVSVERAMARTNVSELADRSISEISVGERQRVLLARAIAQDCPLLLLDEPTASLDINHQVRTLELVNDLVDAGKTAVAAIHDLNLAAHYCDVLLLLSNGRRLAFGSPDAVLTEANLEDAFNTNAAVTRHPVTGSVYVTALPEETPSQTHGRVHVIGGGGNAARLLYLLSVAGYSVTIGALNRGDADHETARLLGLDTVSVPPFAPVDEATKDEVKQYVVEADVTVIADIEIGTGNLPNLDAARESDALVLVEERDFDERNYAGRAGSEVYNHLRNEAGVVTGAEILSRVTELVQTPDDRSDSGEP